MPCCRTTCARGEGCAHVSEKSIPSIFAFVYTPSVYHPRGSVSENERAGTTWRLRESRTSAYAALRPSEHATNRLLLKTAPVSFQDATLDLPPAIGASGHVRAAVRCAFDRSCRIRAVCEALVPSVERDRSSLAIRTAKAGPPGAFVDVSVPASLFFVAAPSSARTTDLEEPLLPRSFTAPSEARTRSGVSTDFESAFVRPFVASTVAPAFPPFVTLRVGK